MKEDRTPSDALDMALDSGYVSPTFATETTDDGDKVAVLREVLVVIHEEQLSNALEIRPLMEYAIQSSKALLFVGGGVMGDALQSLVLNVERGGYPVAAVAVSGSIGSRRVILEDIATVTGAMVIDENLGYRLEDLTIPRRRDLVLGVAKMVRIEKTKTSIVGGGGKPLKPRNAAKSEIGEASTDALAVLSRGPGCMGAEKSNDCVPETLSPAPNDRIRWAIEEVYAHAKLHGMKPPNLKEIATPVQAILKREERHAAAKNIETVDCERQFDAYRVKPGKRVHGKFRAFSLEGWKKSGVES